MSPSSSDLSGVKPVPAAAASPHSQNTIGLVRRRLWLLLLRAFGITVLLIVLLELTATFFILGSQTGRNPYYRAPIAYLLEAYYQGNGSWDGVESLFSPSSSLDLPYLQREWRRALLLDRAGQVLVDGGERTGGQTGQVYSSQDGESLISLHAGEQTVGSLVFEAGLLNPALRLGLELLPPVVFISLVLGALTLVIGLLLMRRVVNPLAEVIAAAQRVAGGDLSARVPVSRRRDDLYVLGDSFNHMAAALEASAQGRREMLADVAHELRTPLAILRGRLEGIVDGVYQADSAHIALALEEVYLLERLVDDLRLLTTAEARQLPLELRPLDLQTLARKVVNTFEAEAGEAQIELSLLEAPSDGLLVLADSQRLEQVIGNLLGNALRYTPTGGTIRVQVSSPGERVALSVTDSGPGVAESELPYIFDRFWRGEKSRARASGGAGLGLAIARQLVEIQGGEIWARNLPGGGFEVGFSLATFVEVTGRSPLQS